MNLTDKHICIICLVALTVIIIGYFETENFGSKKEKASAIYDYFMSSGKKSYSDYQSKMEGKSNIVDYETASSFVGKPNFFEKIQASI